MKTTTVPRGVSPRYVKPKELEVWANREVIPLLGQLRGVANYRTTQKFYTTTAGDGAWTTVWQSEQMGRNQVWALEASLVGTGGTQRWGANVTGGAEASSAGVVTILGSNVTPAFETASTISAQVIVDAINRAVLLQVRDNGAEAMTFTAVVSILECAPSPDTLATGVPIPLPGTTAIDRRLEEANLTRAIMLMKATGRVIHRFYDFGAGNPAELYGMLVNTSATGTVAAGQSDGSTDGIGSLIGLIDPGVPGSFAAVQEGNSLSLPGGTNPGDSAARAWYLGFRAIFEAGIGPGSNSGIFCDSGGGALPNPDQLLIGMSRTSGSTSNYEAQFFGYGVGPSGVIVGPARDLNVWHQFELVRDLDGVTTFYVDEVAYGSGNYWIDVPTSIGAIAMVGLVAGQGAGGMSYAHEWDWLSICYPDARSS